MEINHLADEAMQLASCGRWRYPDTPGSAHILDLAERLASPKSYLQLQRNPDTGFFVVVLQAYEEALNDEWLPSEILGMPLEHAETFIWHVSRELQDGTSGASVARLTGLLAAYAAEA